MTFHIPRRELLEALELLSRNPLTEQTRCVVVGRRPNQMRVDEGDALRAAFNYILDLEGVIGDMMELAPRGFAPRGMSVQAFIDDRIRARNQRYDREIERTGLDAARDAALRERELLMLQAKPFPGPPPEEVAAINALQKEFHDMASKAMGLDPAFLDPGAKPAAPQPAPQPLPAPFTVDAQRADVLRLQGTTKGNSA